MAYNKQNVIFFFLLNDWDIDPRKPFHRELIKATAGWSISVIIQQPVCLLGHFFTRFKQKIVGLIKGKYKTRKVENLAEMFTPVIIFNYSLWIKYKILAYIDIFLFSIQINKFIKKRFDNPNIILWFFFHGLYPLLEKLNHTLVIYDYQDHYDYNGKGEWSENDAHFNELLIKRSDLVICSAKVLYERAKPLTKNAIHIRNGNNFEIFSNNNKNAVTPKFNSIKTPIIGWLGNLRGWLDFELLEQAILNLKMMHFVFIGYLNRQVRKSFYKLLKYENVTWIPYMELFDAVPYVRKFSVGIIPLNASNKLMEAVFPNKFFEYMAAGVPVVTTALPELEEYCDTVGFAKNIDEFIQYCIDAVNGKYDKFKDTNMELAKNNSWESKAKIVDEILRGKILTKY